MYSTVGLLSLFSLPLLTPVSLVLDSLLSCLTLAAQPMSRCCIALAPQTSDPSQSVRWALLLGQVYLTRSGPSPSTVLHPETWLNRAPPEYAGWFNEAKVVLGKYQALLLCDNTKRWRKLQLHLSNFVSICSVRLKLILTTRGRNINNKETNDPSYTFSFFNLFTLVKTFALTSSNLRNTENKCWVKKPFIDSLKVMMWLDYCQYFTVAR